MKRITNNCFALETYLKPNSYQFKFVVDGEWKVDENQPKITDETGNVNNVQEIAANKQFLHSFQHKTLATQYLLYLPENYEVPGRYPLIVCLHGDGERGNDVAALASQGLAKNLSQQQQSGDQKTKGIPFIVCSPQCPSNTSWLQQIPALKKLVDDLCDRHPVDKRCIYLTGFGTGGAATWKMAQEYPTLFAAIAPMCGGADLQRASKIRNLPVWAFHDKTDPIVPFNESQRMVESLQKQHAKNVKFTAYENGTHDCWTEAYQNEDLFKWFLQFKSP